jgi:Anticodon binding domain
LLVDALKAIFQMTIWEMEKLDHCGRDQLSQLFKRLAEIFAIKLRELTRPFYVAMSGSPASPAVRLDGHPGKRHGPRPPAPRHLSPRRLVGEAAEGR